MGSLFGSSSSGSTKGSVQFPTGYQQPINQLVLGSLASLLGATGHGKGGGRGFEAFLQALGLLPEGALGLGQGGGNPLRALTAAIPQEQIPSLTPTEQTDIGAAQGLLTGATDLRTPEQKAAEADLQSFLGTQGQPSAATRAGLKEFQDILEPEVKQVGVLAGQGTSGALPYAVGQAMTSFMVPFLERDKQDQITAATHLHQMGLQDKQSAIDQITAALESAGYARDVATQQAETLFNKQMQQVQYLMSLQGFGPNLLPSLLGQETTQRGGTGGLLTGFQIPG